jgi:uncharacterized membrane protein
MSKDSEKRATITFTDEKYLGKIAEWAKAHKLTQGEVIEVLLDNVYDVDEMAVRMDERREAKIAGRTSIRAMIQKTKGMSPDERKQLMEQKR